MVLPQQHGENIVPPNVGSGFIGEKTITHGEESGERIEGRHGKNASKEQESATMRACAYAIRNSLIPTA